MLNGTRILATYVYTSRFLTERTMGQTSCCNLPHADLILSTDSKGNFFLYTVESLNLFFINLNLHIGLLRLIIYIFFHMHELFIKTDNIYVIRIN